MHQRQHDNVFNVRDYRYSKIEKQLGKMFKYNDEEREELLGSDNGSGSSSSQFVSEVGESYLWEGGPKRTIICSHLFMIAFLVLLISL